MYYKNCVKNDKIARISISIYGFVVEQFLDVRRLLRTIAYYATLFWKWPRLFFSFTIAQGGSLVLFSSLCLGVWWSAILLACVRSRQSKNRPDTRARFKTRWIQITTRRSLKLEDSLGWMRHAIKFGFFFNRKYTSQYGDVVFNTVSSSSFSRY